MGLTGLEPVTLRLSSACSNQLSYRPATRLRLETSEFRFPIFEWSRGILRAELLKSTIANRKSKMKWLPSRSSPRLHPQGQKVRLRLSFGATIFALLYDASEDWRQGDSNP